MSRLTDLISRVKAYDPALSEELAREYKSLASRRGFGLNFERHMPETIELPGCPVRKGDKVRVLPSRGTTKKGNQRLWKVLHINKSNVMLPIGHLTPVDALEDETLDIPIEELVVVAEFRDYIYPGLVSTGKVESGDDKPFHTVVNGENLHVLEALSYTHNGKIDVIYIDPPYNTGAKDWKYNNDYIESEDLYRHSKWLAMMERRLLLAKQLLNPIASALIVAIDEKEYLRLGLLLEQLFPEARIQMVSSVINPKGTGRVNEFSRTDEYIFFALFGGAVLPNTQGDGKEIEVRWRYLRRTDVESARGTKKGGPSQFYPIFVDDTTGKIVKIGESLPHQANRNSVKDIEGCTKVFPIREKDGMEMNWGLTGPSLEKALARGYLRVSKNSGSELQPYIFSYLTEPNIKKIEKGLLKALGKREDGTWIVVDPKGKSSRPTTAWNNKSHEAGAYGTTLLGSLLPGRKFPFPKSLYAVEDCLRFIVADKPHATILDFFSGSGTTAHAVMRLNRQDNGYRQCISVTNNEVAADEQFTLRQKGLRPGDEDWEKLGICEYITKPRIKAALTGKTPEGNCIEGDYKFEDEFPMADGFEENAEFFTLTYESELSVSHNLAFSRIAPLLWMRAGSQGRRIDSLPEQGWDLSNNYGVLTNLDQSINFCKAIEAKPSLRIAYIITEDDRRFQSIVRHLPDRVEPVRLYESYLTNFRFAIGR